MKTIKSFLFVMFMLLASNVMGYSQVTTIDDENVIGVSEWPSAVGCTLFCYLWANESYLIRGICRW